MNTTNLQWKLNSNYSGGQQPPWPVFEPCLDWSPDGRSNHLKAETKPYVNVTHKLYHPAKQKSS